MVVAGVGVHHDNLVDLAQKYFVDKKPIWLDETRLFVDNKQISIDDSVAQYTGGLVQVFLIYFKFLQFTQKIVFYRKNVIYLNLHQQVYLFCHI